MRTTGSRLGTAGWGFILAVGAFFAAPAISEANLITIQNVTVTSSIGTDTRTWCMIGCGFNAGAGNIWAAFANTVISTPDTAGNIALLLTQNPTAAIPSFNFDTSEHAFDAGGAVSCGAGGGPSCTMTLGILTNLGPVSVPLPLNNALNNFNIDPGGSEHQEASNWTQVLNQPDGLAVYIGYADTVHTDACADLTGTVAGNCLPDNPWQGSPRTVFGGTAVSNPEECTRPGTPSCFDAGAIRIQLNDPTTPLPEPATVTLLMIGLAGLGAQRYSQTRKRARDKG